MHWFDRLSERSTRREALKATALAGAALALPLERAVPAHAATIVGEKCTKGCIYTAGAKYNRSNAICNSAVGPSLFVVLIGGPVGAGISLVNSLNALHCKDTALLQDRSDTLDCLAAGCGGFDPTKPGGPCDSCTENCCTCQGTNTGYICCFYPCGGPTTCCPGG
jgi:hypothetical protein